MILSPAGPLAAIFGTPHRTQGRSRTDRAAVVVHGNCEATSPTAQHLRLHTSELDSYPAGVSLVGDGSAPVRLRSA